MDDNRLIYYGYLSRMDLFDITNYPNMVGSQIKIAVNSVIPEVNYASKYTDDVVLISGNFVRVSNYISGFGGFGYSVLSSGSSYTFPNIPTDYRIGTGQSMRNTLKLTNATYTDQEVETAFNNYITSQSISRAQGIINVKNAVKYTSEGCETYGSGSGKFIINLTWNGISSLAGIRINDNSNLSGSWNTSNTTPGTKAGTNDVDIYPKVIFVNKVDKNLATLQSSDYKTVQFTDLLNYDTAGRVSITDNYITFLDHDPANSNALVRVVSKTNFENAANGSGSLTFDNTIQIPLGSTNTKYGFGSQGGSYSFFSTSGTPRNSYFPKNDYIFVTISSNVPVSGSSLFPAVIRIDVANLTHTVWCLDSIKQSARGITYNETTDTAFVNRDSTAFRIPNFSTLTPPYTLI